MQMLFPSKFMENNKGRTSWDKNIEIQFQPKEYRKDFLDQISNIMKRSGKINGGFYEKGAKKVIK